MSAAIRQSRWLTLLILFIHLVLLLGYDSRTLIREFDHDREHERANDYVYDREYDYEHSRQYEHIREDEHENRYGHEHKRDRSYVFERNEPHSQDVNTDRFIDGQDSRIESAAFPEIQLVANDFSAYFVDDFSKYSSMEVVATGYSAGKESTGKDPGHPEYGITYSGVKVRREPNALSTIAADPAVFPLGTVLYVPGYGLGVVADTGSAIKGPKIDLYYETKDQVYQEWGKKMVQVYVIVPGSGKVTESALDSMNHLLERARRE